MSKLRPSPSITQTDIPATSAQLTAALVFLEGLEVLLWRLVDDLEGLAQYEKAEAVRKRAGALKQFLRDAGRP